MSEAGEVKLLDFGLAKFTDNLAETQDQPLFFSADSPSRSSPRANSPRDGAREASATDGHESSIKGTPVYMAPEVLRGEGASRRSDVYALGAVIYSLCAKGPPFQGLQFPELVKVVNEVDAMPLADASPGIDAGFAAVVDRCLRRDPEQRYPSAEELREALEALHEGDGGLRLPAGNPYRGLLPFEAEHRGLFFGRQGEIGTLVERLRTEPSVLVVADSGIGKSSLVRAGVLPLLAEGVLDRARKWRQATMVPGKNPRAALLESLAALIDGDVTSLVATVQSEPQRLGRLLCQRFGEKSGAVLFVDQLEELVTLSAPADAEWAAIALGSLHGGGNSVRLIMTARADYLSRLGTLPGLGEEITRAFYLLRPLTGDRLRDVIVGPARRKGLRFESAELVDRLVESTAHTDSGLPLLQFALAELWEARNGDVVSMHALEQIGGVEGALARHADLVLGRLPIEQRTTARRILLSLVTLEGTRARRSEADLLRSGPAAKAVLEALVRGRLLVVRQTPEDSVYEVAHEALIRGWSTLGRWLETYEESRAARHRLEASSAEWLRLNKASDALWGPTQLAETRLLEEGAVGEREAAFLDASRSEVQRQQTLRRALLVLMPAALLLFYVGYRLQEARELRRRVDAQVSAGQTVLAQARRRNAEIEALRQQALQTFDAQKRRAGDALWAEVREKSAELDGLYVSASQSLEAAAVLDSRRQDVRELAAAVLFERAVAAERDGELSRMRDAVARMPLYDVGGKQMAKWRAPAQLELSTDPADAAVTVAEYREEKSGKLQLSAPRELGKSPLLQLALPAGSYLFTLRAPGRQEVGYPLLLRRGESLKLRIPLPAAGKIPANYVYVPPGRFLFGADGDDRMRRMFYYAVPLHEVWTAGYLIGRYEVTYKDWIEYLEAMSAEARAKWLGEAEHSAATAAVLLKPTGDGRWQLTLHLNDAIYSARSDQSIVYSNRRTHISQNWLRLPVSGISRGEAEDYAAWLARSGRLVHARLCSEQEWERAARGADNREYPHGSSLGPEDSNFDETYGRDQAAAGPDEVGIYPLSASPFGLHDMAGNILEWTSSSVDPSEAVARGGGFFVAIATSAIPNRSVVSPSFHDAQVGVRICADPPR